jgi:hypothetical protein
LAKLGLSLVVGYRLPSAWPSPCPSPTPQPALPGGYLCQEALQTRPPCSLDGLHCSILVLPGTQQVNAHEWRNRLGVPYLGDTNLWPLISNWTLQTVSSANHHLFPNFSAFLLSEPGRPHFLPVPLPTTSLPLPGPTLSPTGPEVFLKSCAHRSPAPTLVFQFHVL